MDVKLKYWLDDFHRMYCGILVGGTTEVHPLLLLENKDTFRQPAKSGHYMPHKYFCYEGLVIDAAGSDPHLSLIKNINHLHWNSMCPLPPTQILK